MTKFLLGVAVGYICSDVLDELLGRTKTKAEKFMEQADEKIDEKLGTPERPDRPDGARYTSTSRSEQPEQTPPPSPPMS